MEAIAGSAIKELVERLVVQFAAFALFEFPQNFFLGRRENGVKPAQHRHGQHDALVLGRTIRAAQQIRDLPDEIGQFVMIGHGAKLLKCEGVSNLPPTRPCCDRPSPARRISTEKIIFVSPPARE